MLIFWPPEPSKIGDSGPSFRVEGWMQGQPARMDRGTFPSGLEGKSGTHSEARRKGNLNGTVMDVGHPDEGEKDHPWKTPCPSSPWVMPFHLGAHIRCLMLRAGQEPHHSQTHPQHLAPHQPPLPPPSSGFHWKKVWGGQDWQQEGMGWAGCGANPPPHSQRPKKRSRCHLEFRDWPMKNLLLCSVTQLCPTLCDPMDCGMLHYLPEFAQTHVHWVSDAIQLSHPPSPPSPPAFNLSQN